MRLKILHYNGRDDKFRLISASKSRVNTITISKIIECETNGSFKDEDVRDLLHDKRTVELLLKDERL